MSAEPFYAVATMPHPLDLVIGKDFGWSWTLGVEGEADDAPAASLADYQSAEVRVATPSGTVIWTLADGDIALSDDVIALRVSGDQTDGQAPGNWPFLLSLGEGADAETPVLRGIIAAKREP